MNILSDGAHDSRRHTISLKGESFKESLWEQVLPPVCPEAEQRTLANLMKLVVERLVSGDTSVKSEILLDSADVQGLEPGKQLRLIRKTYGPHTALCIHPAEYAGFLVSFDSSTKQPVLERPLLGKVTGLSFDAFAQRMREKFPEADIDKLLDGFEVLFEKKQDDFPEILSDVIRIAGFNITPEARAAMRQNMENYESVLQLSRKLDRLGVDVTFFDEIRDIVIIDPDFVATLQSYVDGIVSGEIDPKQVSFDFVES